MKIIGIVCDNYKVEKYKETLKEKGYTDFKETPLESGAISKVTAIKINVPDWKFKEAKKEIEKICRSLEFSFRNRN